MCDIQVLTGLGILTSGYIGLSCYVSAYHWQLVVYLAWLSNLTHVACPTVLRGYLDRHRRERNTRLFFMTVLWVAIFPAMMLTAFFNWTAEEPTAAEPASNARCFFQPSVGLALYERARNNSRDDMDHHHRTFSDTLALDSAILSSILLFFGYFMRFTKLVRLRSEGFRARFINRPEIRVVISPSSRGC
ncbi:hypothetical protein B0T16DRAFT_191012 [Cercophora newfieldiana]|uniref:Uncharacterized protein n=1 Tax=Cercophora newfieldiana TaxID=92897 RepID=A0AA39Y0V6_9PEZI|nr:hypothetical protein B0T16DRAFT_191012 [Cercophora newfieldiana]